MIDTIFFHPFLSSAFASLAVEGIAVLLRFERIRLLLLLRLLETRFLRWLGLLVIVPVRLPSWLLLFTLIKVHNVEYFSIRCITDLWFFLGHWIGLLTVRFR